MTAEKKTKKLRVGVYGITGCAGCMLSLIFNEDELLDIAELVDIRAFPFIKEKKDERSFDVVLLEGTVVQPEDLELVEKLRKKTKILVALGACSSTGGVPSLRNFIDPEKYRHLVYHKASGIQDMPPKPVDEYVKVDYYLPGCPPDKKEIIRFLQDAALGKIPKMYPHPVCVECRLRENRCLLEEGKMCLGPITRGGCEAVCPTNNLECWGCRGPVDDANLTELIALLHKKGFDTDRIKARLETFAGLKIAQIEVGHKKWLEESH
ncbi:hypothetical protein D6764_03995 [Candidatus Woesearchaeota archaeon]|nr:MAG: hypothetical protein D6764_03995 [Candidatus Woesearchaeota archaeon]